MLFRHSSIVTVFLFIISLNACGGGSSVNNSPAAHERGDLVSSELLTTINSVLLPYTVRAYKISYHTIDTDGDIIQASGLISVPVKASGAKSPLLSYQHGTIFLNSQRPSNSASSINGIAILSGTGFIVSAPDYIGYGDSADQIHPYIHAESLASASIDMLKASKTFLSNNGISINDQLFLAGYSEGGYATLALQKKLQENYSSEFNVVASAAGAGPFDLSTTAETLANKTTNNDPSFMSFVLKAYDEIYALNKIDEMYQQPYRNIVNTYFDGNHSGSEIDAALSHMTAELLEPEFLSALQGDDSHIIKDKLVENDIFDWKPTADTRFYHSPNDSIVPYANSVKALTTMQANGATNISLGDCPLDSHADCAVPNVLDTIDFFSSRVNDL